MDILTAACKVLNVDPDGYEVGFAFVSAAKIRELNKQFRGKDKVTDVLSFPDGDINPETGKKFLGDVLICKAEAKRRGMSIVLLQSHSILHLFGYDHETDADYIKMCELQDEIIKYQNSHS